MNNTMALMAGIDIPVPELQTAIHQPTIKEIAFIGEEEYFFGIQLFCFNKDIVIAKNQENQGIQGLATMNNFQIFMALVEEQNENISFNKKELVISILLLLFPDYTVQFSPLGNGLFFNNQKIQHNFMVNDTNFDSLKEVIQAISGLNSNAAGQSAGFNPVGPMAAQIAAKLMSARARTMNAKGEKNSGVLSRYVSILTIGIESMSLNDCLNLTVFQLYDLIERYGLYTGWDLDIRSRLAGGQPESKPEDWMKGLH